jgi:predicted heme/steroid binding protein
VTYIFYVVLRRCFRPAPRPAPPRVAPVPQGGAASFLGGEQPSPEELAKRKAENMARLATLPRLSKRELAAFDGARKRQVYVGVRGLVFDVSAKQHLYKRGASYGNFAGREGSRAFALGQTREDVTTDDLSGLTEKQLEALDAWAGFYMQRYPLVALLSDSRAGPMPVGGPAL